MRKRYLHLISIVMSVIMLTSMLVMSDFSPSKADEHLIFHRYDKKLKACDVVAPDNLNRWYILDLPDNGNWNEETPSPVVMFFHGCGQGAELMYEMVRWNDRKGYYDINIDDVITVYPQGTNFALPLLPSWNDGRPRKDYLTGQGMDGGADDIGFIINMLNQLSENYNIDTNRIYAAGFSNGGTFVQRLAIELSTRSNYQLAAIASVSGLTADPECADYSLGQDETGAYFIPQTVETSAVVPAIPTLFIYGTADNVVDYYEGESWGYKSRLLNAEQSVAAWLEHNGQTGFDNPTESDSDPYSNIANDKCMVYRYKWLDNSQSNQRDVVFYKIDGGKHFWPWEGNRGFWPGMCGDFSATEDIWEFFSIHIC